MAFTLSTGNNSKNIIGVREVSQILWQGKTLGAKEGELIPVTTLKDDPVVNDMEEAAAPEPERVTPFKDCPFAVFEQVLNDTDHFYRCKRFCKHAADGLAAFNRRLGYLVIDRIFRVQTGKGIDIGPVECFNKGTDYLAWLHKKNPGKLFNPGFNNNIGFWIHYKFIFGGMGTPAGVIPKNPGNGSRNWMITIT